MEKGLYKYKGRIGSCLELAELFGCSRSNVWKYAVRLDPPPKPKWDTVDVEAFVMEHPDGATLEEVAEAIGTTKQCVALIEQRALRKLRGEEWWRYGQ